MNEMENEDLENRDELELEEENFEDVELTEEEEAELDEETAAAGTLHPGAAPGETKAQTLAAFTQLAAQLGKEDLSKFFNDMQNQFGPNKAPGAVDKAAANRASVNAKPSAAKGSGGATAPEAMPKLSVKEDVAEMLGTEELSEEFKEKAEVVFEAALTTRVALETARIEEEFDSRATELEEAFDARLEEETAAILESITDKLDQYMTYCAEQFMEENKLAIESSLRTEIAESFIGALQNVFSEHYITVPDEKMDLVAELKAELEETKSKLNEALDEKLELEAVVEEATKDSILDELAEGLADTQAEKLRSLTEGLEYSDADSFKKKVSIIKENYFTSKKTAAAATGLITEEIDGDHGDEVKPGYTAPGMDRYVQAIKKTAKN